MLVDNAIVVTDNARNGMLRGVARRKGADRRRDGPQWGLLGATFIAVCSFLPLYLGAVGGGRDRQTVVRRAAIR